MLAKRLTLIGVGLLALLWLPRAVISASDVSEAYLTDFTLPDIRIVRAAKRGLEEYRDTRQYKDEWIIDVDEEKGTIETNWYPEHKGEVEIKVQIVVWGDSFRVDAYQRVGWIIRSIKKTEWSRRTERHIQGAINRQIDRDK
jgi:hypothetical protein